MHHANLVKQYENGWSWNWYTSQHDGIRARWHGEIDKEMVPRWHAFIFFMHFNYDNSCHYPTNDGHVKGPWI
jgi:hypothetical protein